MMLNTAKVYANLKKERIPVEPSMRKNIPDWKILEKIGDLWVTRVLWGIGYFIFYLVFSPSYWFFLLLPVHFLMGPIHGAIVNWCGHKYGYRNFKELKDESKNTIPFDFLTLGELFQNNHHRFPNRSNFAYRRFEIGSSTNYPF